MYSISGSLFLIFSLVMASVQMLLRSWSYVYPTEGFALITIISLLCAFYFYYLDYEQRKKSKDRVKEL